MPQEGLGKIPNVILNFLEVILRKTPIKSKILLCVLPAFPSCYGNLVQGILGMAKPLVPICPCFCPQLVWSWREEKGGGVRR